MEVLWASNENHPPWCGAPSRENPVFAEEVLEEVMCAELDTEFAARRPEVFFVAKEPLKWQLRGSKK